MNKFVTLTFIWFVTACQSNTLINHQLVIGEEVMIPSFDGKLISASLLSAKGKQNPAIVIITGSGAFSYRTYWRPKTFAIWKIIAESFVKQGYSVLLLEKRGINKSEGNWKKSSLHDRSEDVASAITFLQNRDDIDHSNIGLCGHSQGGWVAQLTASNYPEKVHFIITLNGPYISVKDQVIQDHVSEWVCAGLNQEEVSYRKRKKLKSLNRFKSISRIVKINYLSRIIDYDPAETIASISCPIIAIFSENDPLVVPSANISDLKKLVESDSQLDVITIDSANHFFIPADYCTTWSDLEPGFARDFDELINHWSPLLKRKVDPEQF